MRTREGIIKPFPKHGKPYAIKTTAECMPCFDFRQPMLYG